MDGGQLIDNSDLTTRVYQWLKQSILRHDYLPGDKLDILQLAEVLGVSRTPVKDAINRLTAEGLITLRSRKGTYVATLAPDTQRDLAQARIMVETWAVQQLSTSALAAARDTISDLFERSSSIIAVNSPIGFDYPTFFALDMEMHDCLVSLAGNREIVEIHRSIIVRMQVGRLYLATAEQEFSRSQAAQAEHAAIVAALATLDRSAVGAALHAHLQASAQHTKALVQQRLQHAARSET